MIFNLEMMKMSTAIYDAWKWGKGYDDLILFLNDLNKVYIEDCKEFINKCTPDLPELDRWEFEKYILDKIDDGNKSIERGMPFDIDTSIMVYQHDGKIVLHFFNLNSYKYPKTREVIEKNLKFYGWWNNVDPDENCSEEEWNEREKFFEGMFEKYKSDVPSDCGLVYDFYDSLKIFEVVEEIARERKCSSIAV